MPIVVKVKQFIATEWFQEQEECLGRAGPVVGDGDQIRVGCHLILHTRELSLNFDWLSITATATGPVGALKELSNL